jgi:hypothetical protein
MYRFYMIYATVQADNVLGRRIPPSLALHTKHFIDVILPRIEKISHDTTKKPTSLLKILLLWSSHAEYHAYFKNHPAILENIIKIYSNPGAPTNILDIVNDLLLNLLGVTSQTDDKPTGDAVAMQIESKSAPRTTPNDEPIRELVHENAGFTETLTESLLDHFKLLTEKKGGRGGVKVPHVKVIQITLRLSELELVPRHRVDDLLTLLVLPLLDVKKVTKSTNAMAASLASEVEKADRYEKGMETYSKLLRMFGHFLQMSSRQADYLPCIKGLLAYLKSNQLREVFMNVIASLPINSSSTLICC